MRMASSASEEAGTGRSLEGVSNGQQRCQSSEALAEWRSSEQLENGTPSTSPPYWDSDDDEDAGMLLACFNVFLCNSEVFFQFLTDVACNFQCSFSV